MSDRTDQPDPAPSPEAALILAQAADDYAHAQSEVTKAAAREQLGQARASGNEAAGAERGRR
ncbi:hypothetical protein LHJ74_14595 [Streptomyces sp. N2-109]|uniref:Uncharacterized protein n=1 Tax=Streptomyces gossypii TaxID=2883101 RepID=A0ABT2JTB4_9ACTN|nr:hypothetical protein [Streptomyces gossypii]MCT2591122.1 hypothetical protein [Streptomyces gossypii]